MEIAPQGWSGKVRDPLRPLCPRKKDGYWTVFPSGMELGDGEVNTRRIAKKCGKKSAASLAQKYRGGGKKDWFLPSDAEFVMAVAMLELRAGLAGTWFWTSSQGSDIPNTAIRMRNSGWSMYGYKDNRFRVRPIRAFGTG